MRGWWRCIGEGGWGGGFGDGDGGGEGEGLGLGGVGKGLGSEGLCWEGLALGSKDAAMSRGRQPGQIPGYLAFCRCHKRTSTGASGVNHGSQVIPGEAQCGRRPCTRTSGGIRALEGCLPGYPEPCSSQSTADR